MVLPIIAGIVVACVVAALLYTVFFDGREDFVECLKYYFTPDVISLLRGEWGEDWWAEMKLLFWLLFSAAPGLAVFFWLSNTLSGGTP